MARPGCCLSFAPDKSTETAISSLSRVKLTKKCKLLQTGQPVDFLVMPVAGKQLSPALGDGLGQSVLGHGCKTSPIYQNPSKRSAAGWGDPLPSDPAAKRHSHLRASIKLEQALLGHKQLHSRVTLSSPYQSQQVSTNITFISEPSLGKQPMGDLRGRRQDEERLTAFPAQSQTGCTAQLHCGDDICLSYVTRDPVWLPVAPFSLQRGILQALSTNQSGVNQ